MQKTQEDIDTKNATEKANAAIAGYLLSRWMPYGIFRKLIFLCLMVIGCVGILFGSARWYHYAAIVAATSMSPRFMGTLAYLCGKVARTISRK